MRPDWKEVPRGDVMSQYAGIYVTMNRKGDIVLSRVTYAKLGEPKAFVLLFDRVNSRIGLKPSTPQTRNAYPARYYNQCGAKVLRGHRLCVEYGIELPHTVRFYDARIDDDGIMVLDLRTARISPRAAGHWMLKRKAQAAAGV